MGKTDSDIGTLDNELRPDTDSGVIFNEEHHPDIVLFTGAGASRAEPMALPTMEEFFEEFTTDSDCRTIDANRVAMHTTDDDVCRLLTALLTIVDRAPGTRKGKPDLEAVLTTLSLLCPTEMQYSDNLTRGMLLCHCYAIMATHQGAPEVEYMANQHAPNISRCFDVAGKARQAIYSLLYDAYGNVSSADALATYGLLMQRIHDSCYSTGDASSFGRHIAVFTTNYDWSFETAVKDIMRTRSSNGLNIEFSDGFAWRDYASYRTWALDNYSKQLLDHIGSPALLISYFKLHGSLDWRKRDGTICSIGACEAPRTPGDEPVLIYPGLTKEAPTETPFKEAYANLRKALKYAKACGIIGFAMRDECIKDIFEEALKVNPQLRIVVFQPEPLPEAYSEWRETCGDKQLQWINGKFGDDESTAKFVLSLTGAAAVSDRRRRHVVTGPQKASASE